MLIEESKDKLREIILDSGIKWDQIVVGVSGGKDSSATAQLIIDVVVENKLNDLKVLFLSSDTLIENPLITKQILLKHEQIEEISSMFNLNFEVKLLHPNIDETYLYKSIVDGYSTPLNAGGRWCTRLLKVKPMEEFYKKIKIKTLLLTGVREDESASRKKNIQSFFQDDDIVQNGDFLYSYAPIRNWDLTTLWMYLMDPTRSDDYYMNNDSLWSLYRDGAEMLICPTTTEMALSDSADKCGKSRYGCYLCPLVESDKSLEANIKHGHNFEPYLELRQWYLERSYDPKFRDRMNKRGSIKFKEIFFDSQNMAKFSQLKEKKQLFLNDFLLIYCDSLEDAKDIVRNNTILDLEQHDSIFYQDREPLFVIEGHYFIVYTGRLSLQFRNLFFDKILEIENRYDISLVEEREKTLIRNNMGGRI